MNDYLNDIDIFEMEIDTMDEITLDDVEKAMAASLEITRSVYLNALKAGFDADQSMEIAIKFYFKLISGEFYNDRVLESIAKIKSENKGENKNECSGEM